MSDAAQVHSIDALVDFRAALCIFKETGTDALSSAAAEVQRAFDWLQDQLQYWKKEARVREEEMVQAKLELNRRKHSTTVGGRHPDCTEQEKAYRLATARWEEAQEKIANCKRWGPELQQAVFEYEGAARQLSQHLDAILPKSIVILEQKIASLETYAALAAASGAAVAAAVPSAAGTDKKP